jgi:hypothetical protein
MGSAQKKLCSMLLSVLLLLDSGCAGNSSVSGDPPDQKAEVPITKSALDGYNKYLQKNLPLAFAIGADGRGYGYMYCDGMHCTPAPQARADAISTCNDAYKNHEGHCILFAVGRSKPRKYYVID